VSIALASIMTVMNILLSLLSIIIVNPAIKPAIAALSLSFLLILLNRQMSALYAALKQARNKENLKISTWFFH